MSMQKGCLVLQDNAMTHIEGCFQAFVADVLQIWSLKTNSLTCFLQISRIIKIYG